MDGAANVQDSTLPTDQKKKHTEHLKYLIASIFQCTYVCCITYMYAFPLLRGVGDWRREVLKFEMVE